MSKYFCHGDDFGEGFCTSKCCDVCTSACAKLFPKTSSHGEVVFLTSTYITIYESKLFNATNKGQLISE